mgnify:FL=1
MAFGMLHKGHDSNSIYTQLALYNKHLDMYERKLEHLNLENLVIICTVTNLLQQKQDKDFFEVCIIETTVKHV